MDRPSLSVSFRSGQLTVAISIKAGRETSLAVVSHTSHSFSLFLRNSGPFFPYSPGQFPFFVSKSVMFCLLSMQYQSSLFVPSCISVNQIELPHKC